METKKYTTHSSFRWAIVLFFLWAISVSITIIFKSHVALIIVFSLNLVVHLVLAIQCRLAWHSYMEISEEGVKMKECAKRISNSKKEKVNDLFIPWGEIEKISGGPALELNTGERIKLTQPIDIDSRTIEKAFEQYKSKQPQKEPGQLEDEIIAVISAVDNNKL